MLLAKRAGIAMAFGRETAYRWEADPRARHRPRGEQQRPLRLVSAGRTGTGRHSIDVDLTSLRFVVVGAGRLGASFALALRDQGADLAAFSALTPSGRQRAEQWLGGRASADLTEPVAARPHLYVVAVPDQALPAVAESLAKLLAEALAAAPGTHPATTAPFGPPVVMHTSGATSVHVLDACERAGAATLAFHPLQTFTDPATGRARFAGAAVALTPAEDAPNSPAVALGLTVAHALGCRPFLLPDRKRTLYHAAASVACNYLVGLEHHARRLFVQAGLPPEEALSLFLPLVSATLDNVGRQGTEKALTGPLSRGDTATIAAHLEALGDDAPDLLPLYRTLGLATLDIVRARGEVPADIVDELVQLLETPASPDKPSA